MRRNGKTLQEAAQDLVDAFRAVGRAFLDTRPGRDLERLVAWLARRLT